MTIVEKHPEKTQEANAILLNDKTYLKYRIVRQVQAFFD